MRAPEGAPHGQGAALRRLAGTVDAGARPGQPVVPVGQPGRAQPTPVGGPAAELEEEPDVTGGYDEAVFAPTERPDEPITHGAPFGAGASFVMLPYEDERAFMLRIADQLEGSTRATALRPYIDKLRAGG